MSYTEVFRPHNFIDVEDAKQLCGVNRSVIDLRRDTFGEVTSNWAKSRERFLGETILLREAKIEEVDGVPHEVGWITRTAILSSTEKDLGFCVHHVICDCVEFIGDGSDFSIVYGCEATASALTKKAKEVSNTYKIPELMSVEVESVQGEVYLSQGGITLALQSVMFLLEYVYRHPQHWAANLIGSQHEVPVLAVILNQPMDVIFELIDKLEEGGLVVCSGTSVELSEYFKNEINREYQLEEQQLIEAANKAA